MIEWGVVMNAQLPFLKAGNTDLIYAPEFPAGPALCLTS